MHFTLTKITTSIHKYLIQSFPSKLKALKVPNSQGHTGSEVLGSIAVRAFMILFQQS